MKYCRKLKERLMREYDVAGTLKTLVRIIVHTLEEVNAG
jgi:hypothetical protein